MDFVDLLETNNPELLIPQLWSSFVGFYRANIHQYFVDALPFITIVAQSLIVLFIAGIIFTMIKSRELSNKEYEMYKPIDVSEQEEVRQETQWEIILRHRDSGNPAEWKIAIIEADNLLDEVLQSAGFEGVTLGERLTAGTERNRELFSPLWEVHKLRNTIAHEQGIELTQREVQQALRVYETFFRNFGVQL